MLTSGDFNSAFDILELENRPAIVHASLKSFGAIQGGAETVLGALLASIGGLIMPAFTYKTMLIPGVGPPNNGLAYGKHPDLNRMVEPFHPDMPVDPLIGTLPETLRHYPGVMRTAHPILSFAGFNANDALNTQTIYNPFAPIGWLADRDGWVLLLGVDHTVNTSMHYAEKLAGRSQFVRWALTRKRVVECPNFPGCSDGFEAIRPEVAHASRRIQVGSSFIEAIPLHPLLQAVETSIKRNPLALLCRRDICERCNAIRHTFTGR
jgi:aminoglycoside 3-N-acetyltransferase